MKQIVCRVRPILAALFAVVSLGFAVSVRAADLPLASSSPLTGVAFDDRPMVMPEQRDFKIAMISASSELKRSCGKMETYGWRMSQTEQARVNQIFNNTVDRLRLLGFSITPHTLKTVSKDITLFTADRQDKRFVFLWSAGDVGLVLNLCETSGAAASADAAPGPRSVGVFSAPMESAPSKSAKTTMKLVKSSNTDNFSPAGTWEGNYICNGAYTGATFKLKNLRGRDFDGVFDFYPTPKNPHAPEGSYEVKGQYDRETKKILINPVRWIKRPAGYLNTVMVGTFDAATNSFSAYFEGVTGCTSFEAKREGAAFAKAPKAGAPKKATTVKPKTPKKKKSMPKETSPKNSYIPTTESVPLSAVDPAAKPSAPKAAGSTIEPAPSINLDGVPPPPAPVKK